MKILLLSYAFPPAIGGIETVSLILADELSARGNEVIVVTRTASEGPEIGRQFQVVRHPSRRHLLKLTSWADVVLQSNISLILAWPLYVWFVRKPYLLVHHCPIQNPDGRIPLKQRLKRLLVRRAECFSISGYLAGTLDSPSRILPNPYASEVFVRRPDVERTKDLLFVGRLVYAKGVDTLLRALAVLRDRRGERPNLTVVGIGADEAALKMLVTTLGLEDQVTFRGAKRAEEVAKIMNEHNIAVVPSRPHPPEAFGIVALEATACGCVVVASNCGGLPEAVGNCGVIFETEDTEDLADCLFKVLADPDLRSRLTAAAPPHLAQFTKDKVVDRYESYLTAATRSAVSREA